jgi:hypothetical protein
MRLEKARFMNAPRTVVWNTLLERFERLGNGELEQGAELNKEISFLGTKHRLATKVLEVCSEDHITIAARCPVFSSREATIALNGSGSRTNVEISGDIWTPPLIGKVVMRGLIAIADTGLSLLDQKSLEAYGVELPAAS